MSKQAKSIKNQFQRDPVNGVDFRTLIKLGMKNWMFFGSLEAGANDSLFYTLLANCRAQGLDPEAYLIEVIKRLPHDESTDQAAALTPASIARQKCAAQESA